MNRNNRPRMNKNNNNNSSSGMKNGIQNLWRPWFDLFLQICCFFSLFIFILLLLFAVRVCYVVSGVLLLRLRERMPLHETYFSYMCCSQADQGILQMHHVQDFFPDDFYLFRAFLACAQRISLRSLVSSSTSTLFWFQWYGWCSRFKCIGILISFFFILAWSFSFAIG